MSNKGPINQGDDYDVFIKGEVIDLVVLTEDLVDNTNWYKWFNDEETTQHMQKHYFPNTLESQKAFFKDLQQTTSKLALGIVKKDDGLFIGIVSLQEIDFINRNAEISLLVGETSGRKLIYSQEAMSLMINHGFFSLDLHKIYCGYLESLKDWGIFLCKRFGFEGEGIWQEHVFKHGKYVDVYRLGLIRSKYLTEKGE